MICLYVDDMLILDNNHNIIKIAKKILIQHFDMKDMILAYAILGIKIYQKFKELILLQSHYIEIVIKKYNAFNVLGLKPLVDLSLDLGENSNEPILQLEIL